MAVCVQNSDLTQEVIPLEIESEFLSAMGEPID